MARKPSSVVRPAAKGAMCKLNNYSGIDNLCDNKSWFHAGFLRIVVV